MEDFFDSNLLQSIFRTTSPLTKREISTDAETNIRNSFSNLKVKEPRRIRSKLNKIIKKYNSLEHILKFAVQIFDSNFKSNPINYYDFLNLMNFIDSYILEVVRKSDNPNIGNFCFTEENCKNINEEFRSIKNKIETAIQNDPITPDFDNLFSAVYHAFKHTHELLPDTVLSIDGYYALIREFLRDLKLLPEYSDLQNLEDVFTQLIFEKYLERFERRIRLVLKQRRDKIAISSFYVVLALHVSDDKDGDMFINDRNSTSTKKVSFHRLKEIGLL